MSVAVFRVDAGTRIGTGHLARCLVLARALEEALGFETLFVMRNWPGTLVPAGVRVVLLSAEAAPQARVNHGHYGHSEWLGAGEVDDARETRERITAAGIDEMDLLVVDHYGIGAPWESAMAASVRTLLAIDDLADRAHACDLLLDQNVHGGDSIEERYRSLVPERAGLMLGPEHALIDPRFAKVAVSPRKYPEQARRVLVAFGGVDAGNATRRAITGLLHLDDPNLHVDIAVGRNYAHRQSLEKQLASLPRAELHIATTRMPELMGKADFAIGAGGVMIWERCVLSLPTLAWPTARNQEEVLACLAERGILQIPPSTGAADIAHAVAAIRDNETMRRQLGTRARQLTDGRGVERVLARICNLPRRD